MRKATGTVIAAVSALELLGCSLQDWEPLDLGAGGSLASAGADASGGAPVSGSSRGGSGGAVIGGPNANTKPSSSGGAFGKPNSSSPAVSTGGTSGSSALSASGGTAGEFSSARSDGAVGAGGALPEGGAPAIGGAVGAGGSIQLGGAGGATSAATTTTTPPVTAENCKDNLLTQLGGADGNWMARGEKTCGMQGGFAGFSDGTTCADAAFAPCVADATSGAVKCCFKGRSTTARGAYGCGIAFDLAAIGVNRTLYKAPATGLTLKVTGTAAAGLHIRASVSTGVDDSVACPMIEYKGSAIVGTQTFSFATAKCPTGVDPWASGCVPFATAGGAYAFKLQVVGGEYETATSAGDFDLCIESITPIL